MQFLGVSTARIVVVSLQGYWMEREVNECGVCGTIMALCAINQKLMRGHLVERWGLLLLRCSQDSVCEALFVCLV